MLYVHIHRHVVSHYQTKYNIEVSSEVDKKQICFANCVRTLACPSSFTS